MMSRSGRKATRSWGGRPQWSLSSKASAKLVVTFSRRKTVASRNSSRGSSDSRPGCQAPHGAAAVRSSLTGADLMILDHICSRRGLSIAPEERIAASEPRDPYLNMQAWHGHARPGVWRRSMRGFLADEQGAVGDAAAFGAAAEHG